MRFLPIPMYPHAERNISLGRIESDRDGDFLHFRLGDILNTFGVLDIFFASTSHRRSIESHGPLGFTVYLGKSPRHLSRVCD